MKINKKETVKILLFIILVVLTAGALCYALMPKGNVFEGSIIEYSA